MFDAAASVVCLKLLQGPFAAASQMELEFLLGSKICVASRARAPALMSVHHVDVGAEVAPSTERLSALLALERLSSAVGVSPPSLVCLGAAKVA